MNNINNNSNTESVNPKNTNIKGSTTSQRIQYLTTALTACSKPTYYKSEILPELNLLIRQMRDLTFNEDHAENMKFGVWEILEHLRNQNEEYCDVAEESLRCLEEDCRRFSEILGREIAGTSGEKQALRSLETVSAEHILLHNIELQKEENRGELDAIVITAKGIFHIEVKNSRHDMVIDSRGNYYRARGYMDFNYNIGEKVNNKEYLLRNALGQAFQDAGKKLRIVNIVAFANSRMNVENRYKYVKTCHLSQLPHIITDYVGEELYSSEDIQWIADLIRKAECRNAYPIEFDFEKFKWDFAMVMVTLEEAAERRAQAESNGKIRELYLGEEEEAYQDFCKLAESKLEAIDLEKSVEAEENVQESTSVSGVLHKLFSSKATPYVGAAAALSLVLVSTVAIVKHR